MLYYIGFEGPEELGGGGPGGTIGVFVSSLMKFRLIKIGNITKKLNQSELYNLGDRFYTSRLFCNPTLKYVYKCKLRQDQMRSFLRKVCA